MSDTASFAKLVPGFDFLQGLVKNAGSALPSIGQWVAPTLNPEELEKRIEELRTVQFWLEQNARMLGATIQALEVQRMTLSTLKTMNVHLSDMRDSLTIKPVKPESAPSRKAAEAPPASAAAGSSAPAPAKKKSADKKGVDASATAPSLFASIDPMQAWSALTKQFTQIASTAMKDNATDAAKNLAGAMVKQSFDAAGETLKQAVAMPMKAAKAAGNVASTAAGNAMKAAKPANATRKTANKAVKTSAMKRSAS